MTTAPASSHKTYIVQSMEEAVSRARLELGPDALLLNTRRLFNELGLWGGYEVVFRIPPVAPAPDQPALLPELVHEPEPVPSAPVAAAPPDDLSTGLARLHSQMDEIRNLLDHSREQAREQSSAQSAAGRTLPEIAAVYDRLIACGVDPALSKDIVDRLESSSALGRYLQRPRRLEGLETCVLAELERRVRLAPELSAERPVVALVGPSGAGKTSVLAKLAALLPETQPARVVTLRSSAESSGFRSQQLGEEPGVAITAVTGLETLPGFIAEASQTEFVFIDVPACGPIGGVETEALAAALARCEQLDTHLVVPGYMKPVDLRRSIQRYKIFRPGKLVVTKMDETHSFGSVFSEAAHAGMALSFLTDGALAAIRPAGPRDLLTLAIEPLPVRSRNVA